MPRREIDPGVGDLLGPLGGKKAVLISDRLTPELVIAMVGPVGSGTEDAANIIKNKLEKDYNYEKPVVIIKVSDFIKASAHLVGEGTGDGMPEQERIEHLQDVGNKLRGAYGGGYLAQKCVGYIASDRSSSGYDQDNPLPRRKAFIIDSLKHPDEISVLSEVYKNMFWLFGVFSSEEVRISRLGSRGVERTGALKLMKRDYDEHVRLGQKVSKTFDKADFFIKNDSMNERKLSGHIDRYLEILFGTAMHTPNQCEAAMYQAASISARSACMSRKVGAAIAKPNGEVISVGWNDVPKFTGGLYGEDDRSTNAGDCDHRCYNYKSIGCRNDNEKKRLLEKIYNQLRKNKVIKAGANLESLISAVEGSGVESLIEFSRAIHAEMEAILSVARSGKSGLVGASIFVTTFPCHSCARHIVASGIKFVYFIEAYPKSKAIELHDDAISLDEKDADGKVVFLQYEGIAPKNTYRFFKEFGVQKASGKLSFPEKRVAFPRFSPLVDSFTLYEGKTSVEVKRLEENPVSLSD